MSSSEAPKNAATEPAPANAMASGSNGALRLAGGASSKVKTVRTSAVSETPATTKNRGRQASACAWMPPTVGPSATAPKMHRFMITAVSRNLAVPKPSASGGTAAISIRLVHRPWSTWPPMNIAGFCAVAVSTDPSTSSAA